MTIERQQIIEEMKLRKIIKKGIKLIKGRDEDEAYKQQINEYRLRKLVRKMLINEKANPTGYHRSTGIMKLEKLLHNIIPTLEDDYKELTTDPAQRESFRSHILNAVENSLAPEKINSEAEPENMELNEEDLSEEELGEEKVNISIKHGGEENLGGHEEDPMFIDVPRPGKKEKKEDTKSKEDKEKETFAKGMEDEDETGRNEAYTTFKKIKNQLIDTYNNLANEQDKNMFYDYMLANLKLYFDQFEEEMHAKVEEPESDIYQQQQSSNTNLPDPSQVGGAPPAPLEESTKLKIDVSYLKNILNK